MHRSGTSATAGLLVNLGLTGPRPDDIFPASSSNERGYWESVSLLRCNERLLKAVGYGRYSPPPVTLRWDDVAGYEDIRRAALRWFATNYAGRPMVAKDPRFCLTLPFWRDVLPAPMAAIFVLRHPLSVARSMQARDNFPITKCLAIWDRYIRSASLVLEGLPTLVVEYDSMMADPSATNEEISRFLEHVGVPLAPASSDSAVGFLDSGLRHQHAELDEYEVMALTQQKVFEMLSDLRGPHESWEPPSLAPAPVWVDDVLMLCQETRNKSRELNKTLKRSQPSARSRVGSAVRTIAMMASESQKQSRGRLAR